MLAVHPRIRFTLTEGPAANQTCGPHYVSCGGVAPSALGPIGKPPNWGVSLCWDSAPRWERPRKTFTLARRGTERRSLFPASAGGQRFPALRMVCPRKKEQENYVVSLLFSCAAPGSSLTRRTRLCLELRWGSAPVPARALPRFFRACEEKLTPPGLPRPGLRNALRVWVYSYQLN